MLPGDRCLPGALVCCLFGWLAAVPARSLLCVAFLVLGFTALSAGGRRWSPGASSMCPLAWWFGLLPFRLVINGALLVSAMLGLLVWWLDLLPCQLVVGGPCSVPACHACLVAGSAATSAGGRRCPPSAVCHACRLALGFTTLSAGGRWCPPGCLPAFHCVLSV